MEWLSDYKELLTEDMEIVLIEDNEDDAERMMRFLRSNVSNSITLIQDGSKAAEFLLFETDNIPKLILLDLVLPGIDGIELFQMIKSEPATRRLSVIFLVTSEETKEYVESLGLNPDGFLKKPTDTILPARI
jgi:two-component system, response regulator